MKKLIYIFLLCFASSSCAMLPKDLRENFLQPINLWKPKPYGLGEAPEGGPPEYTQGWKDGCESGLAAYGSTHYRVSGHKYKMDYKMVDNQDYYQAWHDSYTYCRWYVWNFNRPGSMGWTF